MRALTIFLFFTLSLFANDKILSKERLELFNLEEKKIKESSSKLKKDWINPINISLQKSYDKNFEATIATISINQPIFKSGGIYQAIKYAGNLDKYSSLNLKAQKKALIKEATKLLFNIKILEYQIEKQKKLLENAKINLNIKREAKSAGMVSETLVYDAIIDKEALEERIIDLEYQRDDLISKFKTLSNKNPNELELPTLKLISKKEFKERNIDLEIYKKDIIVKNNFYLMTKSRYMPTINIFYNYNRYLQNTNPRIRDDTSYNYGFNIVIPFDVKFLNNIESSKIDYLKAKISYRDKLREERLFFENSMNRINQLSKKEERAKRAIENYNKKLENLNEDFSKGFITEEMVKLYKNKKEAKELDLNIYHLQKEIELLELYAKLR